MKLSETLFTRRQLGQLAGLDASTLTYWTREDMLRPAEGGGGKGLHRRFAYSEVNLAALLMELTRAGVSSSALRGLARKFHEAMDWMAERGVTRENADYFGNLVARHQECASAGGDTAKKQARPGAVKSSAWGKIIAFERRRQDDDQFFAKVVRVAETVSEDEWRFQHSYFNLLTTPPPRRQVHRDPARRFSYFLRHDDGSWTLARDVYDAEEHGRFLAIDTNRLFWAMWSAE